MCNGPECGSQWDSCAQLEFIKQLCSQPQPVLYFPDGTCLDTGRFTDLCRPLARTSVGQAMDSACYNHVRYILLVR